MKNRTCIMCENHTNTRFLEGEFMRYVPTGAQMRSADLYTIETIGIPSLVLMERAALESVRLMEEQKLDFSNVLILCGSGNNGGDGYAIARLLHLKGHKVDIFFLGKEESRSIENKKQKQIAEYYGITNVAKIENKYSLIIDAVFGTGLKRNIEGVYAEIINKANACAGTKIAIDIPSGIHDENGFVMGTAFQADYTIAIAFAKRGSILYPGADYAGKILIGDIGITEHALPDERMTFSYEFMDLKERFPKRVANSHKGSYGRVLIIAGSKGMSGAAYLCAKAAYVVGAGLVQIYTHEDNRIVLQQLLPEAIVTTYTEFDKEKLTELLEWADVVEIGSGLGMGVLAEQIVSYVCANMSSPCVVDADALNILAKHPEYERNGDFIFTPHMKEMSRLSGMSVGEIIDNRVQLLQNFVEKNVCTCVLKDARTLVYKNDKQIYLNTSGNSAMAKGGSGDALAGIITAILAQGIESYEAACLGVYLHGLAGDYAKDMLGKYSVLASDIIESIAYILKQI